MIHYCLSIQSSGLEHFLEEKSLGIHVKGIHIDNSKSHHVIFFSHLFNYLVVTNLRKGTLYKLLIT